ncbi:hypothetical protein M3P05_15630, partial [Sansalvadorimonas sp. 2012CJ34-2]
MIIFFHQKSGQKLILADSTWILFSIIQTEISADHPKYLNISGGQVCQYVLPADITELVKELLAFYLYAA